jgi:uncharacterized repeat protein (TIGR01451 family)
MATLNLGADNMANVGDTISYAFKITNTGDVTLKNIVITDPLVSALQGSPIASLAPNANDSATFTATYTLKQSDINAGYFENIATVTAKDPWDNIITDISDDPADTTNTDTAGNGNPDDPTMTLIPQVSGFELNKLMSANADEDNNNNNNNTVSFGDTLSYTITATNNGNQELNSVKITDPLINPNQKICNAVVVGGTCILTGTYVVTVDDANTGERENTANALANTLINGSISKTATITTVVAGIDNHPPIANDDTKTDQILAQPVTVKTIDNDTDLENNIDPKTVLLIHQIMLSQR